MGIPQYVLVATLEFKEQTERLTLCSQPEAAAWIKDKGSHLEMWTSGMLDHQGSEMRTLCLIPSSVVHVKVANVTWLRTLGFVLRHCKCAVWHHYAWTFMQGENISKGVRDGKLFCLLYGFMWMSLNVSAVGWMTIHPLLHSDAFFTLALQGWQMEVIRESRGNYARHLIFQHGCDTGIMRKSVMRWHWGSTTLHLSLFICVSSSHQPAPFISCTDQGYNR